MWLNKCTRENLSKSLTVGWWCGRIRSMTRQPNYSLFLFTHIRLGSRFWPHSSHTYTGVWVREGRKKSKDWLGIHLLLIFSLLIFFQSKVPHTFYFNINRIHISECLKNQTPYFFTWENWSSERRSDLSKVAQVVGGRDTNPRSRRLRSLSLSIFTIQSCYKCFHVSQHATK